MGERAAECGITWYGNHVNMFLKACSTHKEAQQECFRFAGLLRRWGLTRTHGVSVRVTARTPSVWLTRYDDA